MKKVGISSEKVEKCIRASFVSTETGTITDNSLLREDRKWSSQLGVFMHPSITINNITYRGDLNGYDIFRAVCAGFQDQPNVCKGDNVFSIVEKISETETAQPRAAKKHKHIRKWHIVLAVIVVLVLNLGALYLYRRHTKKKMDSELRVQVNTAVSQYFRLSGNDNSNV